MKLRYRVAVLGFVQLLTLFLLLGIEVEAQSFWPKPLGSEVNDQCPDVNPILSIGGDTLFFSRINHSGNRYGAANSQDIWMSVKQSDGSWGRAYRLSDTVNIARYNALVGALEDGKTFLLLGIFDKPGKQWLRRGFSFITHENGKWSAPRRIRVLGFGSMSEGDLADASITPDGQYIFMSFSRRYGSQANELYVSIRKKDGVYSRPQRLRGPMEQFYSVEAPFFSQHDNHLYFAAKQKNEERGDYNIYYVSPVSGKKKMVHWEHLHRLSDTVNSTSWESYFRPHPGGTFAMMCSDNAGNGRSDIFKVMLTEERPWVKVSGRVVEKRTGELIPLSKDPTVLINGEISDSLTMDEGKAEFLAFMPLGGKYSFSARVPYFKSDTVTIDVTNERLYQEREIDITLSSVPFVTVSGTMLNNLSLTPIPKIHKPTILINGSPVDSVRIDANNSKYSVNLPFGKKYTLAVSAIEYSPLPLELDLTPYDTYSTVSFDVFAKPLNANMVTLKGKLINTKTGNPLEPGIEAKMKVNRVLSTAFKYNPADASYSLMLPAGADYDLVPNVYNFYNKLEVVDLTKAKPRSVVPRDFYVTPLEIGQSVDIENIYFETGKSTLKPASFRSLNALVEFFQEYPNVKVEIGGHTDNVGTPAANRRLSKQRAKAVADYMISQGISEERFQSVGHGPDKPKASNKTAKGRAKNRRVDFTIIGI